MTHPDTPTPTPPTVEELEKQLADILEEGVDKLGELATRYAKLKLLGEAVSSAKSTAQRDLIEAMTEQGMTNMGTPVAKVTLTTRRSLGIAEGLSPDDKLANMEAARKWVTTNNPVKEADIRVNNLKATYEAVLVENPDAPLPDFLVEHETPQLSVRKAQ